MKPLKDFFEMVAFINLHRNLWKSTKALQNKKGHNQGEDLPDRKSRTLRISCTYFTLFCQKLP